MWEGVPVWDLTYGGTTSGNRYGWVVPPGSGYVEAKCDAGASCGMCLQAVGKNDCSRCAPNNDCPAFCRSRGQRSGFCGHPGSLDPNRCCICSQNGDGESNALSECPANQNMRNCYGVAIGSLCEGDGECGTANGLNNCGWWDIYRRVGVPRVVPQQYTHAYWVRWRTDATGYRTLFRTWEGHGWQGDHCALVRAGSNELGFWCNRDGSGWHGTGYDVDTTQWQLVVVTGSTLTQSSYAGTSSFYVGDAHTPPSYRGAAPRVCTGVKIGALGWPGQGPGWISQAWTWDRLLGVGEMAALHKATAPRYEVQACGEPAEEFDGIDDYLEAPAGSMGAMGGEYSFAAWVYRRTCGNKWDRLFDFGNGQHADNVVFSFQRGLTYHVWSGGRADWFSWGGTFPCSAWTHVALTHASDKTVTIYVNGARVASKSIWTPPAVWRAHRYIGRSNWHWDPQFHGAMRDVYFFGRALSADEVSLVHADGNMFTLPSAPNVLATFARTYC